MLGKTSKCESAASPSIDGLITTTPYNKYHKTPILSFFSLIHNHTPTHTPSSHSPSFSSSPLQPRASGSQLMAFLVSKYLAPFMKINHHLFFFKTSQIIKGLKLLMELFQPLKVVAIRGIKGRSCFQVLCFHSCKNLEVGSLNPSFFLLITSAIYPGQILSLSPDFDDGFAGLLLIDMNM